MGDGRLEHRSREVRHEILGTSAIALAICLVGSLIVACCVASRVSSSAQLPSNARTTVRLGGFLLNLSVWRKLRRVSVLLRNRFPWWYENWPAQKNAAHRISKSGFSKIEAKCSGEPETIRFQQNTCRKGHSQRGTVGH